MEEQDRIEAKRAKILYGQRHSVMILNLFFWHFLGWNGRYLSESDYRTLLQMVYREKMEEFFEMLNGKNSGDA